MKIPCPGILLIGPTGSGKTPLGEHMERHGVTGRRAAHFDFGARLRRAADVEEADSRLSSEEMSVIQRSLETGALLTDEQFPIAAKLVERFVDRQRLTESAWLVLNGLPRHVGQAIRLEEIIDIGMVIVLECDPETVMTRIATNAGGDRDRRVDDAPAAVRRKLVIFEEQTRPLIDYYQRMAVPVFRFSISVSTIPEDISNRLDASFGARRTRG